MERRRCEGRRREGGGGGALKEALGAVVEQGVDELGGPRGLPSHRLPSHRRRTTQLGWGSLGGRGGVAERTWDVAGLATCECLCVWTTAESCKITPPS